MIPPPFEYVSPKTIPEAISLLSKNDGSKILAGGQSLIPMLRFRLASPNLLIDINHITDLEYFREEDGWLKIGALTREASLDKSNLIHNRYPLLADTTRMVADPLVRNLATIGGNLAHADPANDHPATMLAYGARVVVTGSRGERTIPIKDFFVGPFESAISHDEILTEIRIPVWQPRSSGAYAKLERKVGDFATAAVAIQIQVDENNICTYAGIGLTNVGLTAIKATSAEESLVGQRLNDSVVRQAAQLAADAAQTQSDSRGSEEYKRSMIKTLIVRAFRTAMARMGGGM